MRPIVLLPLIVLALALPAPPALAQSDVGQASGPEDLLFQEIPLVVSSTRTERSALDVPNAVSVITAEEIRASGARNIEEILHWIPGLEVMRLNKGDIATSMRGFNSAPASTLLVMIDGRTVYLDFIGSVFWESLNVTMQDIERIEFIRGPGSVLYGASALLGTINIITKDPRDLPSLYSYTGLGSDTRHFSNTVAATAGQLGLKASFEYRSLDDFDNDALTADPLVNRDRDTVGLRQRLGNASLDYLFTDGSRLTLSGGRVKTDNELLFLNQTLDRDGATTSNVHARYARGPWRVQAFYTEDDYDIRQSFNLGLFPPFAIDYDFFTSTADFEVQREISWGDHEFLVGGNARRLVGESQRVLGSDEQEMLYGTFLQDEIRLTDNLTTFLGVRLDQHPKSGTQLSPRGSLVYRLSETGRIRASISQSFRNPTMLGTYVSLAIVPGVAGLIGNEDLDPESVTAYELGFSFSPRPRLLSTVDLFYNVVQDTFEVGIAPAGPFPVSARFNNGGRTRLWGGELTLEFLLNERLRGFASYSYVQTGGNPHRVSPENKATAGLRGTLLPRLRYALSASYVSHTEVDETVSPLGGDLAQINPVTHPNDIRSRFVVDAFLGLRVTESFELGLKARNLFHQERRQYPIGDDIGSELVFSGTFEF